MILLPALELLSGKVVRLAHDDGVATKDPLELARKLRDAGAGVLHITDLDAAFESGNNDDVLVALADAEIPFQIGGGIRSADRVQRLLDIGARETVLSTLFYREPEAARAIVGEFGDRIIAALDVLNGNVLVSNRSQNSGLDLPRAIELLEDTGVQNVLYHHLSPGETDGDPDFDGLHRLLSHRGFRVYLRCCVGSEEELEELTELGDDGLISVVVDHASCAEHSLLSRYPQNDLRLPRAGAGSRPA